MATRTVHRALAWASILALTLALTLAMALTRASAAQPAAAVPVPVPGPALGYDHVRHASKVDVSGAPAIPCTRCHALDRSGRISSWPGHKACFGDCHGPMPQRRTGPVTTPLAPPPADDQRRVCITCHAPAALDRMAAGSREPMRVPYPLPSPDHGLAMSHALHEGPSRARRGCLDCHAVPTSPEDAQAQPRPRASNITSPQASLRGHDRCIPCHAAGTGTRTGASTDAPGQPPPMDACERCHQPGFGPNSRPHLVRGPYPVSFSHRRHLARATMDCRDCHLAVARATAAELPTPTMEVCGSCHDGTKAFSVVGPQCRRCHVGRPTDPVARPPGRQPFSHQAHGNRGLDVLACTTCHALDERGAPRPPASRHAPCADAACHRDQFFSRKPTICGACHLDSAPWVPQHFDPLPQPTTELGTRFSHRAHLALELASCTGCHGAPARERDMAVQAGHEACVSPACHARSTRAPGSPVAPGAPIAIDDCNACHVLGLMNARQAQRLQSPWSVRARFRHQPHRRAPGTGAPVPCTACHAGMERTDALDDIASPAKATCVPCHDGGAAFKLTGHGCTRCHGRSASP